MNLALFFTRGISLGEWVESGIIDREKIIYERLLEDGTLRTVYWATYGSRDCEVASKLYEEGRLDERIRVLPKPRIFNIARLGNWLYSFMLPLVHARVFAKCDAYKTNQLDGGWSAALAKTAFRKPLIARSGYTASKLEGTLKRRSEFRLRVLKWGEAFTYRFANVAVVTSGHDEGYVKEKYGLPDDKVLVFPNYVDAKLFRPMSRRKRHERRILYVGRFTLEKNLFSLIDAIQQTGYGLDLYGRGEQLMELEAFAESKNVDARFMGVIPNRELSAVLDQYRYAALVSFTEGMPKFLLESMACGLICVGTNVEGINEVISDGVNGFLAKGTTAEEIHAALQRAIKQGDKEISRRARETIVERFSLDVYAQRERSLIAELTGANG